MTLKRIHRIYFGFDGKPDPYQGYLENWRLQLPDYEIIHWNADNLPLDICHFSREMFAARDHAFLSDYFRWWVVREHGGIYLDADIEIVDGTKFNKIVEELEGSPNLNAFIGIDNKSGGWYTGHSMASKVNGAYARFMCDAYEGLGTVSIWRRKIFYFMSPQLSSLYFAYNGHNVDGMGTSPGLEQPVVLFGVKIFPQDFFSPMTPAQRDGKPSFAIDAVTDNTCICHHFSCSWHDEDSPYRMAKGTRDIQVAFLSDLMREGRFTASEVSPSALTPLVSALTPFARATWRRLPEPVRASIRSAILK
jgi:hypothetical protein